MFSCICVYVFFRLLSSYSPSGEVESIVIFQSPDAQEACIFYNVYARADEFRIGGASARTPELTVRYRVYLTQNTRITRATAISKRYRGASDGVTRPAGGIDNFPPQ